MHGCLLKRVLYTFPMVLRLESFANKELSRDLDLARGGFQVCRLGVDYNERTSLVETTFLDGILF